MGTERSDRIFWYVPRSTILGSLHSPGPNVEVGAVVAFYGAEEADYSSADYLGHYVRDDEWEPTEDVRRTEEAPRATGH